MQAQPHTASIEQDQLLQRADKTIANSERLINELAVSMRKAQQLDDRLHELQQLHIEEVRSNKQGRSRDTKWSSSI
jgi:hypothetical protein